MAHTTHCAPNSVEMASTRARSFDGSRVDADLVGTGAQHPPGVLQRADPAADRERDEDLLGGAVDDIEHRVPRLARCGDVEEHQLVGALGVVAGGQLDRIAGVAQVHEVGALDNPTVGDVEARDDPGHDHCNAPTASATLKRCSYRARPTMIPCSPSIAASARTSSSEETPPLAITGTSVAATADANPSTSGPPSNPSRLMSVMMNAAADRKRRSASSSGHVRQLRPAVDRQAPGAVVEPDGDRHDPCDPIDQVRIGDGRRAHDDPGHPGVGQRRGGVDRAHAATCLHLRPTAHGADDRCHDVTVHRFAGASCVEVDDVQPRRGLRAERLGHGDGIVAVHRLLGVVTLGEPHDLAVAEVDRRVERGQAATASAVTKLPSRPRPAAADFSGWNCVAKTLPARNAALTGPP